MCGTVSNVLMVLTLRSDVSLEQHVKVGSEEKTI